MIRLFVAIDPPVSQRLQIESICFGLPGVRWVSVEQLHLTIARLKNPPLNRIMDFMAAKHYFELPPFQVAEFNLYSGKITSAGAIHQLEAAYPIKLDLEPAEI